MTDQHEHVYSGQTLRHSHPGGQAPHGYFEHPEDGHPYQTDWREGAAAFVKLLGAGRYAGNQLWARQIMDCPDQRVGDPQGGNHCGDPHCLNWRNDCPLHNVASVTMGRTDAVCTRTHAAATILGEVLAMLDGVPGRSESELIVGSLHDQLAALQARCGDLPGADVVPLVENWLREHGAPLPEVPGAE